MPLYEYECHGCGNRFTETLPISEAERRKVRCPKCGGEQTDQVIGAAFVATSRKT